MDINININCTIKNIPSYAFQGCKEVSFSNPDKIENIGNYSFANTKLIDIQLNNVKKIGDYAFGSASMNLLKIGDKLTDLHNTALIDSTINKLMITETENFLTISGMLVDIKKGAIVHVNNIKGEVVIPEQVHTLNSDTFVNCENLTKVSTNKVKKISSHTFVNCVNLTEVNFNSFVETIDKNVFKECPNVDSLSLCFLGKSREEPKGISYLFENMIKEYVFKKITIIDGKFASEPFKNCKEIQLLDVQRVLVKKLAPGVFKDLTIGELVIPDTATKIEEYAFDKTFIEKVINRNNKYIALKDSCIYNSHKLIYCHIATNPKLIIPKIIAEISTGAFQICTEVSHLEIENDDIVFNNALENISLLPSLTIGKIGATLNEIIPNCIKTLVSLNYRGVDFNKGFLNGVTQLNNLDLLQLRKLSKDAVSKIKNPLEITLLNAGTSLEILDLEFLRKTKIENINIMDNKTYRSHNNMVVDNRSNAIVYVANNTPEKVVIDINVNKIADKAFKQCSNLVSINTGKVQQIGNEVFADCESLKEVIITNACTSIGENIIKDCFVLKNLQVPFVGKTLAEIDKISYLLDNERENVLNLITITNQPVIDGTFANSKNIAKIILTEATTTINSHSFAGCVDLKEISITNMAQNVGAFLFFGCKRKMVAHVHSKNSTVVWAKEWRKVKKGNFFSKVKVNYAVVDN